MYVRARRVVNKWVRFPPLSASYEKISLRRQAELATAWIRELAKGRTLVAEFSRPRWVGDAPSLKF